jgi:hypothetical protein
MRILVLRRDCFLCHDCLLILWSTVYRIPFPIPHTNPGYTHHDRLTLSAFTTKNTANNGVKAHGSAGKKKLYATYESGGAYELCLNNTLATKGVCDFNGSLTTKDHWMENMTAHAKTCPTTNDLVYMGYNLISTEFFGGFGKRDTQTECQKRTDVVVGVIDPTGTRVEKTVVKMERPSMQHDLGITATRVVLLDGPLVFDLDRVMEGGSPFKFEQTRSMKIGVLDRTMGSKKMKGADVVWIDTNEPCFAYHVVNCYDDPEDARKIVVDVCKSDGTNALGMAETVVLDGDSGRRSTANTVDGHGEPASDASNASLAGNRDATIRRDTGGAPKSRMKLANRQNAAGHGRDVSCLWRWVVCLESKTVTYVALLGPNTPTVPPESQDFYAHKSRED